MLASQKETTHFPIMQFEATFEDLVKLSPDLKNSQPLANFYDDKEIREIMIIIYDPKLGDERKRRVVGIKKDLSLDEAKDIFSDMLSDLGISATFHSTEDVKKLIPFKKQDREILKKIFR